MSKHFSFLCIGVDKGKLRIRLLKKVSEKIFNTRNKSLYLGLEDKPEDWLKAEEIAIAIENDIRANNLQKNLKYYLPSNNLERCIGIAYNPNEAKIALSNLFEEYKIFLKSELAETTYRDRYEGRFTVKINKSPQDLNKQEEIIAYFYEKSKGERFKRLCNVLHRTIEWGRRQNKLPEEFKNKVNTIQKDYWTLERKRQLPEKIKDIPGYFHDDSYKGFVREEAELIIKGFEEKSRKLYRIDYKGRKYSHRDYYIKNLVCLAKFIKLCFWTGCRTCEASALRWSDIDKDFNYIIFQNAYDRVAKKVKPLKTERVGREGTNKRKFPCGKKLKLLLQEIYKNNCSNGSLNKDDFLFLLNHGNALDRTYVRRHWLGDQSNFTTLAGKISVSNEGIVYQLVKTGKIKQYLTPYSTRHTWINLQLQAGVPITNVAKLAGNSPETIIKNYASFIPNMPLAPEI